MKSLMLDISKNNQVLNAVIRRVMVNVMNVFVWIQKTANALLHYETVLRDPLCGFYSNFDKGVAITDTFSSKRMAHVVIVRVLSAARLHRHTPFGFLLWTHFAPRLKTRCCCMSWHTDIIPHIEGKVLHTAHN